MHLLHYAILNDLGIEILSPTNQIDYCIQLLHKIIKMFWASPLGERGEKVCYPPLECALEYMKH